MPRHIIHPSDTLAPRHTKLIKKLVEELKGDHIRVQPIILELPVTATKSRHVRVIWDEWEDVPDELRSLVILEAYAQLEGQEAAAQITFAEGVTPTEALGLGLLPYKIVSTRKNDDGIALEEYRKAFLAEAKNTVLGPKAKELRYPLLQDAEESVKRLRQALPRSNWSVVQEVASES